MAWIRGRYYARSRWVNGKVVCEYLGNTEGAASAAQQDALEREQRAAARDAEQTRRQQDEAIDTLLDELDAITDLLAEAALLGAGYRRHNRGEWRKRRDKPTNGGNDVTNPPTDITLPTTPEDVRDLLARAGAGDATTLPILRHLLRDPRWVEFLGFDLTKLAEGMLLDVLAGDNLAIRETLARRAEMLREELAGPNPSTVERLLVDRVITSWYQVHDADRRAIKVKDKTVAWATYEQDRLDRAQRRYLSALKALTAHRKLALPAVQVNIAREQVNIAAPAVEAG